ncbi:hypothetical protein H8E77_32040 [bacterium]|nr:hypothetical protein [bacterium]
MDKETLVEKVRQALEDFSNQNHRGCSDRRYSLIMLIPNDPAVLNSKATLLLSAPWLDEESPWEVIHAIINILRKILGVSETVSTIGGITPVRSSDPSVKAINSAYRITNGKTVDVMNFYAFGVLIEKATILESQQL